MRLVLDTNVLISAAFKPGGLEAWVVHSVIAGSFEAWITPEVWSEYEEVLGRPKFAAFHEGCRLMLDALGSCVHRTVARTIATAALDEDDNRFLECAEAAEADFLITGNLRHYLTAHGSTQIVNARGFRDALGAAT